jgi:hypothetical protein
MSGLAIDYSRIREEVADFLGWTRDSAKWSAIEVSRLASILRSGLLQVYFPQQAKPGLVHHWSWMRPLATISTVAPYTTGTVEIIDGVVTLTGGEWPSWAADGELTTTGGTYDVATRDSDTQITLADTSVSVAAGATFSIGKATYELPADFSGMFDGPLTHKPGTSSFYPPLSFVSDAMVRRERQYLGLTDRPVRFSIRPNSSDGSAVQKWEITFYPTPNAAYELRGRYKVSPQMIDATKKYPLGGEAMSEVFLESCLAIAEQRFVDESRLHTERFMALLAAAIENDADSFSPDFLGYNSDRSEHPHSDHYDERMWYGVPTFEGQVYY